MDILGQFLQKSHLTAAKGKMRVAYAEQSKTYAYSTVRVLGNLYVVEGLE